MKRKSGSVLLFLLLFQLFAAANPGSSAQPETGNVYFFRLPNYSGSGVKMTILSNGQAIAKLRNASYFRYEAEPGDYIFSFGFGSSSTVSLNVEPGEDYYIKCYFNMGLWSGIPILELVDPVSGKSTISGNRLSEQTPEPVSVKVRNSRTGLLMSGGIGFETYPWFIDENGDDVKLSTGGGFGIGVEFGHQFSKHFDLSFNGFFQGSSLSERLKNASGSFNRMGLTVTPAIVIPVKGGDLFRFRLGAGPGLYSFGTMKIDASELEGTKMVFKYKPAVGFHGLFMFESNFMENASMSMGIRYSNIRYEYTSAGSSHGVNDPELVNPDGSGIDFILGYNFLF